MVQIFFSFSQLPSGIIGLHNKCHSLFYSYVYNVLSHPKNILPPSKKKSIMNLDRGLSRFVVLGGAISLPRLSFFFYGGSRSYFVLLG